MPAAQPEYRGQDVTLSDMISGLVIFSTPWNLLLSGVLGIWLMAAPAVLGIQNMAATSDYIVGALVITSAVIAGAEPVRALRYFNVVFGAWLMAAPWLLSGGNAAALWSNVLSGLALILLSLRRGEVKERYGGWDRFVV